MTVALPDLDAGREGRGRKGISERPMTVRVTDGGEKDDRAEQKGEQEGEGKDPLSTLRSAKEKSSPRVESSPLSTNSV